MDSERVPEFFIISIFFIDIFLRLKIAYYIQY